MWVLPPPLDCLPVIIVVPFLISKQFLRACVFLEQIVVLKIRFLSYMEICKHIYYTVVQYQQAILGDTVLH